MDDGTKIAIANALVVLGATGLFVAVESHRNQRMREYRAKKATELDIRLADLQELNRSLHEMHKDETARNESRILEIRLKLDELYTQVANKQGLK